jgi:hypothetical protein
MAMIEQRININFRLRTHEDKMNATGELDSGRRAKPRISYTYIILIYIAIGLAILPILVNAAWVYYSLSAIPTGTEIRPIGLLYREVQLSACSLLFWLIALTLLLLVRRWTLATVVLCAAIIFPILVLAGGIGMEAFIVKTHHLVEGN